MLLTSFTLLLCSGWLLIAEVRSRFDPNNGGADPEKFTIAVKNLGFSLVSKVSLLVGFFMHSAFLKGVLECLASY